MSSKYEELLDEKYFNGIGMDLEQKNNYLNIIKNCKDVCDTENKIDNVSKGTIVEMTLTKEENIVSFNGSLTYQSERRRENRCIKGMLVVNDNTILVDYEIVRLCTKEYPKEYRVTDEFKLENNILTRKSKYSYNKKSIIEEITNKNMKGRLK